MWVVEDMLGKMVKIFFEPEIGNKMHAQSWIETSGSYLGGTTQVFYSSAVWIIQEL